jgi:hypothetical protein
VKNSNGSVVMMVANHAVSSTTDNNGSGVAMSVSIDTSALGAFSTASLLVIDKDTNVAGGPIATTISPGSPATITLNGYAVGFLTLKP